MRFRIAVQKVVNGKYVRGHNVAVEADSIDSVVRKIRRALTKEVHDRQELFVRYLNARNKGFVVRMMEEISEDLIDYESRGKGVSKKEFLASEMDWQ